MKPPNTAPKPLLNKANLARGRVSADGVSPLALDFFAAANGCTTLSAHLHPIQVRNTDIVTAWRRWSARPQFPEFASLSADMMASTRCRFDQNVELLCDTIKADPTWKKGQISADEVELDFLCVMPTAALMFWERQHAVLEMTDTLEEMLALSDLGNDLPIGLVRPPFPACYIRFGKTSQAVVAAKPEQHHFGTAIIQGVYVFDSAREENRSLAFVPIYYIPAVQRLGAATLDLVIDDETQSLNESIFQIYNNPEKGAHLASIAQIAAKVFLYMALTETMQAEEHPYTAALAQLERVGPKKAAKLRRQVDKLYDRILLGPSKALSQDRGETAPHWRRGHFRTQPHGPRNSLRKVMFIAPVLVRADRLAAGNTNTATKPNRPNH